MICDLHIGGFW